MPIEGPPRSVSWNPSTEPGDGGALNDTIIKNYINQLDSQTRAAILALASAGPAGESAYEVAVANGFVGTEAQWLASLVGPQGIQGVPGTNGTNGTNGQGVPTGGTAGQMLAKINSTNYNTEWVDPPTAGAGSGPTTEVMLSSFAGANDDAKLTAAMAYCAAQTYKGITIVLDLPKLYSFSTKQPLYSGFSLRGGQAPHDQDRSSNPQNQEISLSTSGGWFYLNQANTYSCTFEKLTLNGGSSQRLVDGHASNVLWTSVFRDITAVNLGNVLGSVATKLLNTTIILDGFWNINNIQERAWVLGGSDTRLAFSQCLIDSPGDTGQFPNATYLLEYSSQSKTPTQNLYITAEYAHSAILIGSGSSEHLTFLNCTVEGRNAGSPQNGRLVRVQGTNSIVTFRDCWFAYAMANPGTHTGVIMADNGQVLLDGCTYERATGVAESVPLFHATAGKHIVRNIRALGFTGKPVVRQTGTATIDADSSVTLVTV